HPSTIGRIECADNLHRARRGDPTSGEHNLPRILIDAPVSFAEMPRPIMRFCLQPQLRHALSKERGEVEVGRVWLRVRHRGLLAANDKFTCCGGWWDLKPQFHVMPPQSGATFGSVLPRYLFRAARSRSAACVFASRDNNSLSSSARSSVV